MPRLLRRLTCFYCGKKSANSKTGRVRQWHCRNCDAVNFLDENGQITDPPASETQNNVQYAHIPPRSTSPELASANRDLFCHVCQKNQHLLTESLANYLPSQDHPDYAKYEAAAAQYRKSLEERYPQVCANCIPKVRDRIKLASYAAKTDHMRRLLQQTRQKGIFTPSYWGWKNILIFAGGQAYLLSLLFILLWHVFGALLTTEPEDGMSPVDGPTYRMCLTQAAKQYGVEPACFFSLVLPLAKYAFILAVCSIWWNSSLQTWVRGSRGRMVGLGGHLKLQLVTLAVRAASLWYLQEPGTMLMALHVFKAGHMFMVVFILLTSFISSRMVKIDTKPRFSFNDNIDDLLPLPPHNPNANGTPNFPESSSKSLGISTDSSFPIHALAQAPSPVFQYPASPTIPSSASVQSETETEATTFTDTENRMDWTPTRPSFQPLRPAGQLRQPLFAQPQPQQPVERSPFYGALPPAPKMPSQKIANPWPQPVFQRVSATSQKDFFSKLRLETENTGSGAPIFTSRAQQEDFQLHEPQLQYKEDPVDTGLEAMFGSVFSIGDEPAEVKATQAHDRRHADPLHDESSGFWKVSLMVLFGFFPIVGAAFAIRTGRYEIPWETLKALRK